MDVYSIKVPRAYQLIKIIFSLIVGLLLLILVLVVVMKVNVTAAVDRGELISENAPDDHNAPFESVPVSIAVREGDFVHKGDTLVILNSESLLLAYDKALKDYQLSEKSISVFDQQLGNMESKNRVIKSGKGNIDAEYSFGLANSSIEGKSLKKQLESVKSKVAAAKYRLEQDKKLYIEGLISQNDYVLKSKAYLEETNQLTQLQQQVELQLKTPGNLKNNFSTRIKEQQLNVLNLEQEILVLKKTIIDEQYRKGNLKRDLEFQTSEMNKRFILARTDGYITNLFSTQKNINFLEKGRRLLTVNPRKQIHFMAKLYVKQNEIKEVLPGQKVHLKMDAYNYYKYGILEGVVHSIAKDTASSFCIWAEIPETKQYPFELKSGYLLKGEIIIRREPLYVYIFRNLFGNNNLT